MNPSETVLIAETKIKTCCYPTVHRVRVYFPCSCFCEHAVRDPPVLLGFLPPMIFGRGTSRAWRRPYVCYRSATTSAAHTFRVTAHFKFHTGDDRFGRSSLSFFFLSSLLHFPCYHYITSGYPSQDRSAPGRCITAR